MPHRLPAKVIPFQRHAAASSAEAAPETFDPLNVIIELTFSPEPQLCMRTVKTKRQLTPSESAEVGRQLRRLQAVLVGQYNSQTGAGSAFETDEPTAP